VNFRIIDAPQLRRMFGMRHDGTLIWTAPPKQHMDLVGCIAGSPIPNHSGKAYWAVQIAGRKVKRSHIVFCLIHGRWPSVQVDHIDGNSLNDAPNNLREATATQNAWNHKKRAKKSALPMGVKALRNGRFQARIGVHKESISLGTFPTPETASEAYQRARVHHFGEFA
jgi:hypothetical protein